jgi:hypothetical protein
VISNLRARYERLAAMRRQNPSTAVVARFNEIDGMDKSLLLSLEVFTTVIPLMILGYGFMSGFAESASPATAVIRSFGITSPLTEVVRETFSSSAELSSLWTVAGLAGFLFWGIPMSITVAGMFAAAWRREQFGMLERLGRGAGWFALYLVALSLRQELAYGAWTHLPLWAGIAVSLIPAWIFWSITPVILVRGGGRGFKFLMVAGLAGALIDGLLIPVAARLVFPSLLEGFLAFGPIGVAMALLTWCAAVAAGWVVTACASAIWWERRAPTGTVLGAESGGAVDGVDVDAGAGAPDQAAPS